MLRVTNIDCLVITKWLMYEWCISNQLGMDYTPDDDENGWFIIVLPRLLDDSDQ